MISLTALDWMRAIDDVVEALSREDGYLESETDDQQ